MIRAVIAQGGAVDLIADSSLALLGAVVAGEYFVPQPAEGFRGEERRVESAMRIFPTLGREDDENEELHHISANGQVDVSQTSSALGALETAANRSAAMVCIGAGDFGEFASRFRRQNPAPIFTFVSTGADSAHRMDVRGVFSIDAELDDEEPPRSRRRGVDRERRRDGEFESRDEQGDKPVDFEFQFPPLVLAAQIVVERIAENDLPSPRLAR